MMGELEGWVEAISGEFKSEEVANTLWAFATMGTMPGEPMMGELERPGGGDIRGVQLTGCCSLCFSLPSIDFDDQRILCQLNQFLMSHTT
jgi:hypothetical protein